MKTDRASMAHSLEARVPFLDPVVTNFALALPVRHRVSGLRKKVLLRKAVAPLVPNQIVRGKKRGFSIPAAAWLRGELEPFARETLSADTLRRQGFFRPEAVTALIDRHVAGKDDLSRQLWGLLAFTLWYERHVEREPQALREPQRSTSAARRMKVWIDITAPAHVLVFRPLIAILRGAATRSRSRRATTRRPCSCWSCTGSRPTCSASTAGARGSASSRSLTSRLHELRRWARGREFDVALAHGSHELTMTARRLGIPSATTFDYEFAWLQHQLGCRAATRVVVPEAIPPERLARYGARPPKLVQYPGLKEEYYLADFEPDPAALEPFELDPARTLVVVRTPPDVSLYHRRSNPLFPQVLEHLGRNEDGERDRDPAHRGAARRTSAGSACRRCRCPTERWTRRA